MASTLLPRRGKSRSLRFAILVLLGIAHPAPASGQWLQSGQLQTPLVPGGHLRLGFDPGFTSWDTRFGMRTEDGTVIEEEEPLGLELNDPAGFSLFPGLATLQSDLGALTDRVNPPVNLGETQGSVTKNITRLDFGAHLGIFDWLTVGATLPWVKTRTALELLFRPDGGVNLGLNPALSGDPGLESYLATLNDAAAQADARAQDLCGADGSAAGCQAAQDLAQRAMGFADRAQRMYGASPFFLVAGTPMAEALTQATAELADALTAAGLPGLGAPAFAGEAVDETLYATLAEQPGVGAPLQTTQSLWQAGDLELEATVRLLDGEVRDSGALSPRFAWTLVGGALVRLGTGAVDDPGLSLDVGAGDGQMDLEGFGYAGLRVGTHLELRATGRYGVQRSTTLPRRIVPPEAVFPPLSAQRTVVWTPGDYLDLLVSPRWHASETLTLAVDYRRFHKASDTYELVGSVDGASEPDVALLALETERTAQEVGFGVRYTTLGLWRRGETGTPVEVGARVVHTFDGFGGQTPKTTRAELSLRLYRRLWGG